MSSSAPRFVPGRLCLFGEHSDWAAAYREENSELAPGACLVTGTESGIRVADAEPADALIVTSVLDGETVGPWAVAWEPGALDEAARSAHAFRYIAGTAAEWRRRFDTPGVRLRLISDLPARRGLSSSASACLATLRGLSAAHGPMLSREAEMELAYLGERRTGSACGRLDQVVAHGRVVTSMGFDGPSVSVGFPRVGRDLPLVVVDLGRDKDTRRILDDLHACFPDTPGARASAVREALGPANLATHAAASDALALGDAERLGELMLETQRRFDRDVVPASAALDAPMQRRVLGSSLVAELGFGGKGVGSQGEGSVQIVARGFPEQKVLAERLATAFRVGAWPLTLPATAGD